MTELKARDVMTKRVKTLDEEMTLREAAEFLASHKISGAPVVDSEGNLVGLVSEADLMDEKKRKAAIPRLALYGLFTIPEELLEESYKEGFAMRVRDVMTTKVLTATPETSVEELADVMLRKKINRVPILHDGKLVGIVTRHDILRGLAKTLGSGR